MANITIEVPSSFQRYAGGMHQFEISAATVGEAVDRLITLHPELRIRLMSDNGKLFSYMPFFLNGNKLPDRGYRSIEVSDGDHLEVFALASGG